MAGEPLVCDTSCVNSERVDIWGDGSREDEAVPAAIHYDDVPVESDELAEPSREIEETVDDGGISDVERIVRVWVDDGRLVKVRVSPNWHTKLERRKNASLAQIVTAVLQIAHVGAAAPGSTPKAPTPVELTTEFRRSLPTMTEATLRRMDEHYAALHARFAEAKQQRAATVRPQPAATVGRSKGVTVKLNRRGHATTVEFDEHWLDSVQAGEISTHVMRAAQDAYGRYVPEPDDDELNREMAREFDYMRKVMYAMLTPEERR